MTAHPNDGTPAAWSWHHRAPTLPLDHGRPRRIGGATIRVICTLGPASRRPDIISGLDARGVDLFRINLSHTDLEEVEPTIDCIRRHSGVPISLDTEGAQVRCGPVVADLVLGSGAEIELVAELVEGAAERMTLTPHATFADLRPGSVLSVDFHGAVLRVLETGTDRARAIVERGGRIGSNKAVTVDPAPALPALTEKDVAAIAIGCRKGIEDYALSFAASGEGVRRIRELIPPTASLISKIESRAGVRNMDEIIEASDAVLIDRGDLSREVPLEEVPYYQKAIVRRANRWHKPLYVATNLLESMVLNNRPTIAEVNDIANTLLDGAHGLVLAAETAIGLDPLGAVDMVRRAIDTFEREALGRLVEPRVPDEGLDVAALG
jgi:pyruvate kinase